MKSSIVVPTYRRERVLVETIRSLLSLPEKADELLVVDQTPHHDEATEQALADWERRGAIRRLRPSQPSIPRAMNAGLQEARGDLVLFLDDDIIPDEALIGKHIEAHLATGAEVVAGQVLQPGEEAMAPGHDDAFRFCQSLPQWVDEFIGCNFSVNRQFALRVGGFDENFVGAAYRYEAEFSTRVRRAGGRVFFEPSATIRHLRAPGGGTRAYGEYLTTLTSAHSVGAYYCFLRTKNPLAWPLSFLGRLLRSVRTRHHLRRPWGIPVTLAAEISGMSRAVRLAVRGPRLVIAREDFKT